MNSKREVISSGYKKTSVAVTLEKKEKTKA